MIGALILGLIAIAQALVFPANISRVLSAILLALALFFTGGRVGSLVGDQFTQVGMLAVLIPAIVTLLFHKKRQRHFVLLVTMLTLAGYLVAASRNLATLVISLESLALAAAAIAFYPGEKSKMRVTATYLIFSVMAAVLLFTGLAFYFAGTGTVSLTEFTQTPTAIVGLTFLLAAIMLKLAIFPMHAWAVDVYSLASTSSAIYLSTSVKAAVMLALGILLAGPLKFAYQAGYWQVIIPALILVVCSIAAGAAGMAKSKGVKRLLAFSSIAHAGFLSLVLATPGIFSAGVIAYYALVYSLSNTVAFAAPLLIRGEEDASLEELSLLYKRPLTALAVAIAIISLLGLPPTAGFNAKLLALFSLFKSSEIPKWFLLATAIAALIFTAATAYGYIKVVGYLAKKPEESPEAWPELELLMIVYAFMILLLYFYPIIPKINVF